MCTRNYISRAATSRPCLEQSKVVLANELFASIPVKKFPMLTIWPTHGAVLGNQSLSPNIGPRFGPIGSPMLNIDLVGTLACDTGPMLGHYVSSNGNDRRHRTLAPILGRSMTPLPDAMLSLSIGTDKMPILAQYRF